MRREFKQIWKDISSGENIDLYLTIIIAIGLGILNLIGYGPAWISSVILAALGVLTGSTLRERRDFDKTVEQLKSLQKSLNASNETLEKITIVQSDGANALKELTSSFDQLQKTIIISGSVIDTGLQEITFQSRKINWDALFEDVDEIDLFLRMRVLGVTQTATCLINS